MEFSFLSKYLMEKDGEKGKKFLTGMG